jgi:ketopantoate hydroxymethyltransferase
MKELSICFTAYNYLVLKYLEAGIDIILVGVPGNVVKSHHSCCNIDEMIYHAKVVKKG